MRFDRAFVRHLFPSGVTFKEAIVLSVTKPWASFYRRHQLKGRDDFARLSPPQIIGVVLLPSPELCDVFGSRAVIYAAAFCSRLSGFRK
jgi:hypothetical protein